MLSISLYRYGAFDIDSVEAGLRIQYMVHVCSSNARCQISVQSSCCSWHRVFFPNYSSWDRILGSDTLNSTFLQKRPYGRPAVHQYHYNSSSLGIVGEASFALYAKISWCFNWIAVVPCNLLFEDRGPIHGISKQAVLGDDQILLHRGIPPAINREIRWMMIGKSTDSSSHKATMESLITSVIVCTDWTPSGSLMTVSLGEQGAAPN